LSASSGRQKSAGLAIGPAAPPGVVDPEAIVGFHTRDDVFVDYGLAAANRRGRDGNALLYFYGHGDQKREVETQCRHGVISTVVGRGRKAADLKRRRLVIEQRIGFALFGSDSRGISMVAARRLPAPAKELSLSLRPQVGQ
jgi:hypothetical protein